MTADGSSRIPPRARQIDLERLARIVEDSEDAIIGKDLSGRITSWNRSAEHMFGYTAEEIVGRPILLLIPESLHWQEEQILSRIARGEKIDHVETSRVRKDGAVFQVSLTVSPIRTADGRIVGASKIVRDITEATKLKAELEAARRELSEVSRANDLNHLANGFAHELSQPLSACRIFMNLIHVQLDHNNPAKAHECCQKATAEVDRAVQIIDRLRQSIVGRPLDRRRAELAPLIEEAFALALIDRPPSQIAQSVQIGTDAEGAFLDKVQLLQVLVNLLRNAAEATDDQADKAIAVETRRLSSATLEVKVSDTGRGLDPRVHARLFEPFNSSKPGGMGIGLSLCRRIIDDHGGEIRAGNGEKGGAWFAFTLPVGP